MATSKITITPTPLPISYLTGGVSDNQTIAYLYGILYSSKKQD